MPDFSLWVLVSLIVLLLVCILICMRRIQHLNKQLMETNEAQFSEIIKTIDHHRHDWMNDVQVLYGYIQLNKQEKLLAYMERISEQMRCESLISKLGIPILVAYLISFRANTNTLILRINLEQEISLTKFGEQGMRIAKMIIAFVEVYKSTVIHGEGEANELVIAMNVQEDQLFIEFEYDGAIDKVRTRDNLHEIIERIHAEERDSKVITIDSEQSIDIEVRVSLTKMAG